MKKFVKKPKTLIYFAKNGTTSKFSASKKRMKEGVSSYSAFLPESDEPP